MTEKILKGSRLLLELSLFAGLFVFLYRGYWQGFFLVLTTFAIIYFTKFTFKRYKIKIPIEFEIAITGFLYTTLFLGEAAQFYGKYVWWDTMLHSISGVVTGLVGFLILFVLYETEKLKTGPLFIFIFSLSFSVMLGTVWEIFEFWVDQTFFQKREIMQAGGLEDTMIDLIVDFLGATASAFWGVMYMKNRNLILSSSVNKFVKYNSDLFKKDELDKIKK